MEEASSCSMTTLPDCPGCDDAVAGVENLPVVLRRQPVSPAEAGWHANNCRSATQEPACQGTLCVALALCLSEN